jgi:hypothetical protein
MMTAEERLDALERWIASIQTELDEVEVASMDSLHEMEEFAARRGWRLYVGSAMEGFHFVAAVEGNIPHSHGPVTLAKQTAPDRLDAGRAALRAALAVTAKEGGR